MTRRRTRPLPRLAGRVFGTPLLMEPGKAEAIIAAVGPRLMGWDEAPDDEAADEAPELYQEAGNIAIIRIFGILANHPSGLDVMSGGLLPYDQVRAAFDQAMDDEDVAAILLDIDSFGGEVAGCFDLADHIFAARGTKPIWAFADEYMFSGAYALGSAADRVIAPRTGNSGSIGVITCLIDGSAADEKAGLKYTLVYAGARKADFNEHAPTTQAAIARAQKSVANAYEIFVSTVARNRRMTPDAVRATEALTYQGADAMASGLVDAVMSRDDCLAALGAAIPDPSMPQLIPAQGMGANQQGVSVMTEKTPPEASGAAQPTATVTDLATIRAAERSSAVAIVALCNTAGFAVLAEPLLSAGATLEQATARIEEAKDIAGACKIAGRADLSARFLAEGKSLSAVTRELQTMAAVRGAVELQGEHGRPAAQGASLDWAALHARENKRLGFPADGGAKRQNA